jgi:predicted membrane protein
MDNNQFNENDNKTEKINSPSQPPSVLEFQHRSSQAHIWIGAILLFFGIIFLLNRLNVYLPAWLISWQMTVIAAGVLIGVRQNFRGVTWAIVVLIGTLFLLNEFLLDYQLHRLILPIIFIGAGLFFIFRPKKPYKFVQYDSEENVSYKDTPNGVTPTGEDIIEAVSIFGGTKKKVFSKSFKGGDIVNIFGGSQIDLTQADFSGTAVIEITALFGGATLLVPSHWHVISNAAVTIFGDIKDRRVMNNISENNKTLLLRGTVIFGGVDVKSF